MLPTVLGVRNDQFTYGTCRHALWIAKTQSVAGATPDPPVLKLEQSKRSASRLARWKWPKYSEAHDEMEHGILNLSLVAAGYLTRESVDEAFIYIC